MNFLAHLYLSGNNPQVMIGNFIADQIKGSQLRQFENDFRKGILLHRAIDDFTDTHPVVEKSKQRLRPQFRKYAPVITDVFYDHFLARDWEQYHYQSLKLFSGEVYSLLEKNNDTLPERTKHMLKYMIPQNWLLAYAEIPGIEKALGGLSRRTKFESGMENSPRILEKYYDEFNAEFNMFFADLRLYVNAISF